MASSVSIRDICDFFSFDYPTVVYAVTWHWEMTVYGINRYFSSRKSVEKKQKGCISSNPQVIDHPCAVCPASNAALRHASVGFSPKSVDIQSRAVLFGLALCLGGGGQRRAGRSHADVPLTDAVGCRQEGKNEAMKIKGGA